MEEPTIQPNEYEERVSHLVKELLDLPKAGVTISKSCIYQCGIKIVGTICTPDWVDSLIEQYPELKQVVTGMCIHTQIFH